jgi:DNA-binding Lrp family transcriptional regulator
MSVAGILDAMRSDRPLSQRLVWQCLENHANGARFWAISISDLAEELHLRPATVIDAVHALEAGEIIRADRRRRQVTVYYMLRTYEAVRNPEPDPVDDSEKRIPDPVMQSENRTPTPVEASEIRSSSAELDSENRQVENPPSKNPPEKSRSLRSLRAREKPERDRSEWDAAFREFYAAYPRHKKPDTARKAFFARLREGVPPSEILDGLRRHVFDDRPQFQPYPASWLNGGQWRDEPDDTLDPALRAAGLTAKDLVPWQRSMLLELAGGRAA